MDCPPRLSAAPIEVDLARRQVRCGDQVLALRGRAFDLLAALAARPGEYIDTQTLTAAVWPGRVVEPQNLRVQVNNLRQQLGADALSNLPGSGYRLERPVRRASAAPQSRLIGRAHEQQQLAQLSGSQRLLTVTGIGGIGKTALVRHWFDLQVFDLARGGAWVDLAGSAGTQLPGLVAGALCLRDAGKPWTPDRLLRALPVRQLLLVLDNAEHLLPAVAALVHALLDAAPLLRIVVTSQMPLRLPDEHVLRLPPLDLPQPGAALAQALGHAALQLLVERVQALVPGYTLAQADLAHAITLCRRLDGVPLAIELAAARVPALGLGTLVTSLDERLQLLHSPQHSRPERQQTLRAALEWTHGLLDPPAQTVFARLGVFAGSFTLGAALAVAADAAAAGPLDRVSLIDAVQVLVDASLLAADVPTTPATAAAPDSAAGDGPVYRLLETTRLYALQRLHDSGQYDTLRRRHLAWCLAWVPGASPAQVQSGQSQLKVALDWALSGGDPPAGALLAGQLLAHPGLAAAPAPAAAAADAVDDTLPRLLERLRTAGAVRQAETAGLAPDTLLAMARRLRPTEARDLDGAVRELLQAVDLIRATMPPAAPPASAAADDTLLDQALADVAEHARHGRFDEGSDCVDAALQALERQEAARREAHRAACRRLIDSGLQQDLLRRDAFAVARRTEALLALDAPDRPTHSAAWAAREEAALQQGQQSSTGLWLDVAAELAQRRLAQARSAAERVDARRVLARALCARGEQQVDSQALQQAVDVSRAALAELVDLARADHNDTRGALQHGLAQALFLLGQRAGNVAVLEEAVAGCAQALQVRLRARVPLDWAATQHLHGNALRCLGMLALGTARLEQAAGVLRDALHERTPSRAPLERAQTLNVLGITLSIWATREDTPRRHLEALAAQQAALALVTRASAPVLWAGICNNIGIEYNLLGSGGIEPESSWRSAIDAFQRALQVQSRETVPAAWARTQHNLGVAQAYLGEHLADPVLLQQAEQAFSLSLLENTLERQPLNWAASKNDLGTTLTRRGRLTPGPAGSSLIEAAIQHLQDTLAVRRADAMPNEWLRTQGDIAQAQLRLAQHTGQQQWAQRSADTAALLLEQPAAARMPVEREQIRAHLAEARAWLAGTASSSAD